MSKIKYCKLCKYYKGLNKTKTIYLCWRLKLYSDYVGDTMKCENCENINKDGNCKNYKFSFIKYMSNK